jgi:uncharacterized membrane protein YfcA
MSFADPHLWLLLATYFCTSAFSAAVGMGGGIMITAVLATMLPVHAVVPVQSSMLFFNTGYRLWLYRMYADWRFTLPFLAGLAVGGIAGAFVYVNLPEHWVELCIGLTILVVVWAPGGSGLLATHKPLQATIGTVHGFLTSVTGISGLLQGVFSRFGFPRKKFIGTFSVVMFASNVFRLVGLFLAGVSIGPYLGLIVLAIPVGMLGAQAGKRFLDGIDDKWFHLIFKSTMTVIAILMLYRALT